MTAALDTPAALFAELAARGIELQACGDRLRFRPPSAMTAELVARVKAHKPALLALLADTKTPADDTAAPGFGCGVSGDVQTPTADPAGGRPLAMRRHTEPQHAVERVLRVLSAPGPMGALEGHGAEETHEMATWVKPDDLIGLPAAVAELVRAREGWTPDAWRARLLQLADCSILLHSDRAALLNRAAAAMTASRSESPP